MKVCPIIYNYTLNGYVVANENVKIYLSFLYIFIIIYVQYYKYNCLKVQKNFKIALKFRMKNNIIYIELSLFHLFKKL
jgi:hypothetical protein